MTLKDIKPELMELEGVKEVSNTPDNIMVYFFRKRFVRIDYIEIEKSNLDDYNITFHLKPTKNRYVTIEHFGIPIKKILPIIEEEIELANQS